VTTGTREWERSIVARITAGDDSALAVVYDQYSSLVFGITARMLGRSHAADVCQEVFVALWEHPERFDDRRGSLRTFLATIARRRCLDELRRTGRRRATEARADAGPPTRVPNVDEAALAMMTAERVRAALDRLPTEQRTAIELAYFDGMTFREVAVAVGAPEGTTKSRIRIALRRLSHELVTGAGHARVDSV